jgi:hypothetical protein
MLCVAAWLLFSLHLLRAQPAPDAYDPGLDATLIEKGLNSTLPLQVAIAAYRTKQDSRFHSWGPQLRQALVRSIALQPEAEAVRTRRIILDALALASFAHCSVCSRFTPDFPRILGGRAFIFWLSEDQTRRSLTDGIEQYVRECRALLDALGETGFSEAEIRSKVRIWIQDGRQSRTVPIPAISSGVQINHCQNMTTYCGM